MLRYSVLILLGVCCFFSTMPGVEAQGVCQEKFGPHAHPSTVPSADGQLRCKCDDGYEPRGGTCAPKLAALPQCLSSAKPSCAVYSDCFERTCNCEATPDRYFISYGQKYCQRFLGTDRLSAAGNRWREKTLVCLQEKIVPHLPTNSGKCDCGSLKRLAIASHVECYTQPGASICDLGPEDWKEIYNIVDREDMDSREMLGVAQICLGKMQRDASPSGVARTLVERVIARLQQGKGTR
jgi:hypothetical protein